MESNSEPVPIPTQKQDPTWKHCQMFKVGERVQLQCVYCNKLFKGGGIHRVKEHLACQKGNVSICLKVPPGVRLEMQHSLDGVVVTNRKKRKTVEEVCGLNQVGGELEGGFCGALVTVSERMGLVRGSNSVDASSSLLVGRDEEVNGADDVRRKKKGGGRGRGFVENGNGYFNVTVNAVPAIHCNGMGPVAAKKANHHHVHLAIARFLYDIGCSLNAVNSRYFQPMLDAIASVGSEVTGPSYHDLRGWILQNSVAEAKSVVSKNTANWGTTGCSILVDQQTMLTGRTLLSFSVYCPQSVVFLKSVDVSDIINSPDAIYEMLRQVVEEVGVRHVLQVINSVKDPYIVAGRRLMDTFPSLYWGPCASHCVDLILQDFAAVDWIKTVIEQAKSITRFIYNNRPVLNIMRKFTFGVDIVEPGMTNAATNFSSLKRIVHFEHNLQSMVTSQEWKGSPYSKKPLGLEILDLINDESFRSSCRLIVQLTIPLLRILRIACSKTRPAMGYIYAGMYRAKETIKKELLKREKYIVLWNIIDHWWERCNIPLHAAGFFLNPKFFYSIEGAVNNDIQSGMFDCIEKLVSDTKVQDKIIREVGLYKNATGDFGRKIAVRARDSMLPDEWWSTYGGSCPNLACLAVRILGQTCSSIGSMQNHIRLDQVHDSSNCLEHQRLRDLVFVQSNMHLQKIRDNDHDLFDPISFDNMGKLDDWLKENELCREDSSKSDWTALVPPSPGTKLLWPSPDEIEELGTGFKDAEIFEKLKEGDGRDLAENVER